MNYVRDIGLFGAFVAAAWPLRTRSGRGSKQPDVWSFRRVQKRVSNDPCWQARDVCFARLACPLLVCYGARKAKQALSMEAYLFFMRRHAAYTHAAS